MWQAMFLHPLLVRIAVFLAVHIGLLAGILAFS
jgi:ABC-type proline/glycine betaine transport system permease subunit